MPVLYSIAEFEAAEFCEDATADLAGQERKQNEDERQRCHCGFAITTWQDRAKSARSPAWIEPSGVTAISDVFVLSYEDTL